MKAAVGNIDKQPCQSALLIFNTGTSLVVDFCILLAYTHALFCFCIVLTTVLQMAVCLGGSALPPGSVNIITTRLVWNWSSSAAGTRDLQAAGSGRVVVGCNLRRTVPLALPVPCPLDSQSPAVIRLAICQIQFLSKFHPHSRLNLCASHQVNKLSLNDNLLPL